MEEADLNAWIDAATVLLEAAVPGSDQQVEAVIELTDLLGERYAIRLAAGDVAGAGADLMAVARRLDDVAAATGANHEQYAGLALRAGLAREEQWRAFGDPVARDDAVARLTGLLSVTSESDPIRSAVHAELAGLYGTRSEDAEPDERQRADLDAAIEHARAGLAWLGRLADEDAEPDGAGSDGAGSGGAGSGGAAPDEAPPDGAGAAELDPGTVLRAILGFALADRFRAAQGALESGDAAGVAAARADRDDAVVQLGGVLGALVPDDPDWRDVAGAISRLRYDRYGDPWPGGQAPDSADLDAVIDLLAQIAGDEPEPSVLWGLVAALTDRIDLGSDPGDRDALIGWAQRLLDHPDISAEDVGDIRDLLGESLLDRAEGGSPTRRADLDAAIGHWEAVLAAAPPADADQARLVTLLAHACWLRLDGDASRHDEVDQLVDYAGRAWQLVPPDDETKADIGFYLALGVHEQFLRPGQPFGSAVADLAIEAVTQIEPLVAERPDMHLVVVVELGHFLVSRGQMTGAAADLAAAQPWVTRAAAELTADHPQFAELSQTVAADMFILASLGMIFDDFESAIRLLRASVRNPSALPGRAAMARSALGMAHLQLAGVTQSGPDLAEGIAQLTAAFDLTAAGDPYRIVIAWNLGPAFLSRFLRTGDVQDRDAARYYLDMMAEADGPSGEAIRDVVQDVDVTRTATRGLLRLAEGLGGDQDALADAVRHLRDALAMVPAGHPYEARIRGDLGLALTMRAVLLAGHTDDFELAVAELRAAMDALPAGHMMAPMLVMRAGGALTGAAVASRDPGKLRAAIDYMTSALGEVDQGFSGRVRLVATLGGAWEQLYHLTGDRAALDAAARWLAGACDELADQPGHPEHARCLTRLAHVQLARGFRIRARDAGLAALRARGREVLLQTGTGRGVGIARLAAAEATEVAGWCLADRQPEAAVDALELGRALVLHAATSVADVSELLTGAGRPDLAAQWRRETGSRPDAPWDVGLSGAERASGLLAGTAALELPNDLRARALEALAGPAADQLLAPPALAEITGALAATGADALVYLLGPAGAQDGRAIVVPAAGLAALALPQVIPLPQLRTAADGAIDDYTAAHDRVTGAANPRPGSAADPADGGRGAARRLAVDSWNDALKALCEWAWPAVMGPLLDRAGQWGLGRPPRLVLVPVGRLSLVPWHAAVARPDGPDGLRYTCAEAVISYAASGRQLIDVSSRAALDLQASPVIVGNPTLDLPYAGLEAQAIRDRCYPAGRYLGHAAAIGGRAADGAGEPVEVLSQLPGTGGPGASMMHLACHAVAVGSAPGRSYLVLAHREVLRLDAVLQRTSGRSAAAGGLVSLAACGSDLAPDDYDEALTLATAFLAAGAVTVVGTRWEVPDGHTALLMFMFHHFLTAAGQPPRDALRMAQLWMLDPGRTVPPEMPPQLAKNAVDPDLAEPFAWAALTHQGR